MFGVNVSYGAGGVVGRARRTKMRLEFPRRLMKIISKIVTQEREFIKSNLSPKRKIL